MIYTVHISYSKDGVSDVEYFEMLYNHSCGKEMTAKKQGQSLVPNPCPPSPPKKSVD